MSTHCRLWIALGVLLSTTFAVLLLVGNDIYRSAPPMPERVVSASGETVYTRTDIEQGLVVWQSICGQQLGSIWGHGALVAPDWTADWLHREAMELLQMHARSTFSAAWDQLKPSQQDALEADLRIELRKNTFDPQDRSLHVSNDRALAIANVAAHYILAAERHTVASE
jgi:nitric oxide reductase subunit B